jgi:SAM-dependent methyltransferase
VTARSLRVAAQHRWLLRRWLTELTERRWLTNDRLRAREQPARADLRDVCRDLGFSTELAQFFQRCNQQLLALLQGRILTQELLFPDGDFVTAEAAYRAGAINRYLNAATREIVSWAPRRSPTPVRILEIGAGIGGTTTDIIPALTDINVDYHFTDVSQFFLTTAQEKFADYPWMRYGLVDLNSDLDHQPPADIVLAANVLHNAHHSGRTLRELHDIVTPGGMLVFIESCREHCQLLTSMHFLMSPRTGQPHPRPRRPPRRHRPDLPTRRRMAIGARRCRIRAAAGAAGATPPVVRTRPTGFRGQEGRLMQDYYDVGREKIREYSRAVQHLPSRPLGRQRRTRPRLPRCGRARDLRFLNRHVRPPRDDPTGTGRL